MARPLTTGEKPLDWVGSSKRDFLEFPAPVKGETQGAGVFEIVEHHDGNTYRAVYTVRFPEVVYALHAFQKKSPKGIRTARSDVELIERRLKMAQRDYEARYGTSKI